MIEVELSQGKIALIDDADFGLVSRHKWSANKIGRGWYATTKIRRADGTRITIKMHRMLLGLTDPKTFTDHIDGNGLNNQRANLRACTRAENGRNRGATCNNTSGFKGVSWHKGNRTWDARIWVNGKNRCLGSFSTPEAAYAAYCAAALELHGEFANFGTPPPKRWAKPSFEIIHTGAQR